MRAMVLCAGLGTRLRPLTERWPKPAIPLLGVPLLRYTLSALRHGGVREVGINLHHLPAEMERVGREEAARLGLAFTCVHEDKLLGTGGGIRGLRRFLDGDVFVVANGDNLFPLELAPVIAAHRASGAAATLVLLPMPAGARYAAVELDEGRNVRRIGGVGPGGARLSSWHFTGVHVMSPAVFDFMSPEGPEDINRQVYIRMIERGLTVRGEVVQSYWSDLGSPSLYLATQRDLLMGQVPLSAFDGAAPFDGAAAHGRRVWSCEGARFSPQAIAGPAFLDRGCDVSPGARLGSAVYVGPAARVGDGARLNRVAVLEGTEVAAGEELVEQIAWGDHRIAAPLTSQP